MNSAHLSANRPRWVSVILVLALLAFVGAAVALYLGYSEQASRQLPERRFSRAQEALQAKNLDQVRQELAALESVPEYTSHCNFLRGALMLSEGALHPALDQFGHTVHHPQLRADTLVLAGEALYRLGLYQDAQGLLVQAVQENPDLIDAHRWLASSYYDLGLNGHAEVHLKRVAELDPDDPRPDRLLGLIHKDFERYDLASAHYLEVLRKSNQHPDHQQVLLELGECQIKLRSYAKALETLARSAPSVERAVLEAECHYSLGRSEQAQAMLNEAIIQSPAHLPALLLLGTIALESDTPAAAVAAFSQAAKAYPKDYTARFKLAQAYQHLGDTQQAEQHGQIAAEIKQLRERFSKLHETAAERPADADVRCELGLLAHQLDRPDLAQVWFRAALAIDPNHAETIRNLQP